VSRGVFSCLIVAFLVPELAAAQATSPAGEPQFSFSGYFQPQFELHSDGQRTTDRALFRRMVLAFKVMLPADWNAEFQIDAGPVASGGDRLIVKNAYLQYTGWQSRGLSLTIGNQKLPFSRSVLAPSSGRGLIERPFAGDRSFGSPGRAPAVKMDGWHRGRTIHWSAALAASRHSPDPEELRLDGPAEAGPGWNEGALTGGRIELHPLGEVPRAQGDLSRGPVRFTLGAGAYSWWNDDDVERHAGGVDADRVAAVEVSGGLRGRGLSVDAEFEHIVSHAVESAITTGLYSGQKATIDKGSIEAGYMVLPRRLEALAAVDRLTAAVFEHPWHRAAAGIVWYVRGPDIRVSFTHRASFDERGIRNRRSRSTYLQTHLSF
jgi:phosphate-selective porin OprO and OprP